MNKLMLVLLLLLPAAAPAASSTQSKVFGDWVTGDKSVVRMYECGSAELCGKLIRFTAPVTVDARNANPDLRKRNLCSVNIAEGFKFTDATHATGGQVYDPESGKTYKGAITLDGDALKLRGFVGIALFGRTETWHRVTQPVTACS